MNFEVMPELGWRYGYPAALLVMFAAITAIWWWFRKNNWL